MKTILFSLLFAGLFWSGQTSGINKFQLDKVIENLKELSSNLTSAVTSYQPYRYDSYRFPMDFIKDGGHDLYDNGNMIRFVEGRKRHNLEYNATITTTRYNVTTIAINPFVALAAISNPSDEPHFYTFRVNGDLGADGRGKIVTGEGEVTEGNGVGKYYTFQVYDSGDPSLCEVFFTITNKDFYSKAPSTFRVIRFSTSTRVTNNIVRISGRPHNVYFGLIVLSRAHSQLIPESEIKDVMRLIMRASAPAEEANAGTPAVEKTISMTSLSTPRPAKEEATGVSATITSENNNINRLSDLVREFESVSSVITNAIEDFYFYNYDTFRNPMNMIRDGGKDMYDSGNLVKFVEDNHMQHLMYNRTISTERYDVTTRSIHPFVTLAFIKNPEEEEHDYSIRVTGDIGADGEGNISMTDGKLTDGNGFLKFYAFQVFNSGDPTICEVYFTITNTDWNSRAGDAFTVSMFSKVSRFLNNEVRLSGRPRNVVFGYTLLSRSDSVAIPDSEIIEAMKIVLRSTLSINNHVQSSTDLLKVTKSTAVTSPTSTKGVATSPFETSPESTTLLQETSEILNKSIEEIWRRSGRVQNAIANIIPTFYYYGYDDVIPPYNSINDGGLDMYDSGNKVQVFYDNEEPSEYLEYNTVQTFTSYDIAVGGNGHPFMTLVWIRNNDEDRSSYSMKVSGNLGADGKGEYTTDNGRVDLSNGIVRYSVFQVYGTSDPSVCEVYFVITRKEWRSSGNTSFEMTNSAMMTNAISTTVRLSGTPRNTVMGYALLSRISGNRVRDESIREFLRQLLNDISSDSPARPDATSQPGITSKLFSAASTVSEQTTSPMRSFTSSSIEATSIEQATTESIFGGISQLREVFRIIELNRGRLSSSYPDWYSYRYDGENEGSIQDGGFDMYDTGNVIEVFENSVRKIEVEYDQSYEFSTFDFQSVASDPFISMLWIKNEHLLPLNHTIRVISNPGSDGRGQISQIQGIIRVGNLRIEYKSFQIHNAGDGNICEVYFIISDFNETMSNRPDTFELFTSESSLHFINNSATISGRSFNVLFGYALLSRFPSTLIGKLDIESFLISAFNFAPMEFDASPVLTSTLAIISERREFIMTSYEQWYSYRYDGNAMTIADGGHDMFDNGNIINVFENGRRTINVIYDEAYSFENFDFQSQAGTPFVALLHIKNEQLQPLTYSMQVQSDTGADGSGTITKFDGILTMGDVYAEYYVFQISGTSDASICEVYFALQNLSDFQANSYDSFDFLQFYEGSGITNNTVTLTGRPRRIILGYMLLSRYPSNVITNDEVRQVLRNAFDPDYQPTMAITTVVENKTTTTTTPAEITTEAVTTPEATTQFFARQISTLGASPTTSSQTTMDVTTEYSSTTGVATTGRSVGDMAFLPSCSVKGTVQSIFRCERLFRQRRIYTGPASCRDKIDEVIRCVGNQLLECRFGGGINVLDSFNLPMFNSKSMVSLLYNITTQTLVRPNFEINAFCFHAGLNLPYPHRVVGNLPGCTPGTMDALLDRTKTLYYRYVWARNRDDVCRAFRSFKSWFLKTASTNCNFQSVLYDIYPSSTARYLTNVARIILETLEELNISACAESLDTFALDRPGLFTKHPQTLCEDP